MIQVSLLSLFNFAILTLFQGAVPYKPSAEFEIQVDYQFKQRNSISATTIDFTETVSDLEKKRNSGGVRPYLILNLKLLKLSDQEVKARAGNNLDRSLFSKKVKEGDLLKIDMGFTDDVKDRVGAYEVTVDFLSPNKTETSRIHMFVKEDGTFLVNGEVHGKF